MCPLSTWNGARATEELNFSFYLILIKWPHMNSGCSFGQCSFRYYQVDRNFFFKSLGVLKLMRESLPLCKGQRCSYIWHKTVQHGILSGCTAQDNQDHTNWEARCMSSVFKLLFLWPFPQSWALSPEFLASEPHTAMKAIFWLISTLLLPSHAWSLSDMRKARLKVFLHAWCYTSSPLAPQSF